VKRLSQELSGQRDLNHCHACDMLGEIDCIKSDSLERWLEHDDTDRPTATVVILCGDCSDRLIEPHPRLYRRMMLYEPHPGCMPLCRPCQHREGISCTHEDLKANGGQGLGLTYPTPGEAIVCSRGKGCRHMVIYEGPVSDCAGLEKKGAM